MIVKADLLVCQTLSVPLLLGEAYIDNNAKIIYVEDQQLILKSGCASPIIRRCRRLLKYVQTEPAGETK